MGRSGSAHPPARPARCPPSREVASRAPTARPGTLPATGRHITVHACDIYEVRDGKIQEGRTYLDTGAIMSQLGLTEQLQG
ncbi:ester cyclase [Streptomyces peucetius]|nr:hypothetical protein CGZ69_27845 [Streptomyces peucetius subsp. caesius ATCC 27952]